MWARELAAASRIARAGGAIVRAMYELGDIAVDRKADDSPVTAADRAANAEILAMLGEDFPADAVLSEEEADSPARLSASRVWIVDPLDGTRDFVARTGQFSVHVALAVDGRAVVGAVYQPIAGALYAAAAGLGAWLDVDDGARSPLRVSSRVASLRVGTSRLNAVGALGAFISSSGVTPFAMGASTKHCALAAGELDACVNLSPGEQEWDTCAPEVVVREAGGTVTDGDGRPFRYNQRDLAHHRGSLFSNGACHAALLAALRHFV
ncbi:MAG TPA: 3'(2'),5'-bisphosphate nucleotidase CysQ [Kofleriaceae bacterium]|jgi:3'(2'),5'-bisphosphate nucleotidase